jgi:hypothetical protein
MTPKFVIAAVICFSPTLINMIRGLESATANEHEPFRVLWSIRSELFWRLGLPALCQCCFLVAHSVRPGRSRESWLADASDYKKIAARQCRSHVNHCKLDSRHASEPVCIVVQRAAVGIVDYPVVRILGGICPSA